METKIIFVTGKKQAGKDTACLFIKNKLIEDGNSPTDISIYSFAEFLKQIAVDLFGIEDYKVYGTNDQKNELTHIKWCNLPLSEFKIDGLKADLNCKNEEYMTGREFLQVFGTQICRRIFSDCWAYNTLQRIKKDNLKYALISDARFPNELEVFKDHNPLIIRLTRNPFPDDIHESEIALDNYDFDKYNTSYIFNHGLCIDRKNIALEDILRIQGLIR